MHRINLNNSPMRQGKSLMIMKCVEYALAANKSLYIATMNVDSLYDEIKFKFPDTNLKKDKGGVIVNSKI